MHVQVYAVTLGKYTVKELINRKNIDFCCFETPARKTKYNVFLLPN